MTEPKVKKEKKVKAPIAEKPLVSTVRLISYEIKAVIPTGAYANVQPCIVVEAENLTDAQNYVLPHLDELFERYLNRSERRTVVTPTPVQAQEVPVVGKAVQVDFSTVPTNTETSHTPSFNKAVQAISSCLSLDALDVIVGQIEKSTRLTAEEKNVLVEVMCLSRARVLEANKN